MPIFISTMIPMSKLEAVVPPEKPSRFALVKRYRKVLFVGLAVVGIGRWRGGMGIFLLL